MAQATSSLPVIWGVKHTVAHRFAQAKSGGPCVAQPGKPKCASGFTSSHYSELEKYLGRAVCGHHALKMDGHSRSLRLQDDVIVLSAYLES